MKEDLQNIIDSLNEIKKIEDGSYQLEVNEAIKSSLRSAIGVVAIENTLILKENHGWEDMPMIDSCGYFV